MKERSFFRHPIYILVLLYISIANSLHSQNIINIKEPNFPHFLTRIPGQLNAYKFIEPYRSSYLELKPNGTFLYYNINSLAFEVCMGTYTVKKPLIKLVWDSISTYDLVKDTAATKLLFKYKKAIVFKPLATLYKIKYDILESINFKYDKIELLLSSDYNKKGPIMDSFVSIQYTTLQQKIIAVKRISKPDLIFKKDSIWGFKIYKDGGYKIYRNDPFPLNWNMFPGLQIAQIEKGLIIYMVENTTKTYNYYFGKNIDSAAFFFDKESISKEFKNIPCFIDSLTQNSKWLKNYGAINERTHNFKVVDQYRSCSGLKKAIKEEEIKLIKEN